MFRVFCPYGASEGGFGAGWKSGRDGPAMAGGGLGRWLDLMVWNIPSRPVASTRSSTVSRRIVPSSIPPIIRRSMTMRGSGSARSGPGMAGSSRGCGRRLPPFGVDDSAAVVEVVGSAGPMETCGDRSAFAVVPLRCGAFARRSRARWSG